jgi:hypothetical protein
LADSAVPSPSRAAVEISHNTGCSARRSRVPGDCRRNAQAPLPRRYVVRAEGEVYVLERSAGGWAVFYSERGNRNDERWFPAEGQALEALKAWLLRDPTTRKREL